VIDDPFLVNDWHPVCRSEQVGEGGVLGTRLLDEDLVLWRDNGTVMAWRDLCVHRGTRLSLGKVKDSCLVCPYHGWTYGKEGRCVLIPAHPDRLPPSRARVHTYQARERYGLVWVSLGHPERDVPPYPDWEDAGFRKVFCGPYEFKAGAPRAIENFLDIAHLSFVHDGILGDSARPEIPDYTAVIGPDGVEAKGVGCFAPDMYGTGNEMVFWTYRVFRPLTAYLVSENEGPKYSLVFFVTPRSTLESTGWAYLGFDSPVDQTDEEISAWQDSVTFQDMPIVESQRPELLPLDLQEELHLRSDRLAVAYRRWLRELGVTFATA
jgi:phenylpropionate dioxygenase-like ring-hydroxylating dioxygenase large terminal subunit